MPYERQNIQALHAYVPGEQPATRDVVKLNTNENPYPPALAVMQAVHNVQPEDLRRYSPPTAATFRQTAARVHGLTPEHVIATNGGDELLRLLFTAFSEPNGPNARGGVGLTHPTYSLYAVLAQIQNTSITRVDRDPENFALPEDLPERWNHAGCRLGFLVNPHAPSGRRETPDTLAAIAERFQGVLVIDEAYVDFAQGDAVNLLDPKSGLDNVILLRSLSKGYSLAGLRFGYGLGHPGLIEPLDKVRDSYNLDAVAQTAAIAALEHREHAAESWRRVVAERTRLQDALAATGWSVLPSESNFLLAEPPGAEAHELYQGLKARGIFVRYFADPPLSHRLRITVGTPEQNAALLHAVGELLAQPTEGQPNPAGPARSFG